MHKINGRIKTIHILILIIFLGIFLRFYNLGAESFWLDEGSTALAIKKYDALQILNNIQNKGLILPEYFSGLYNHELPLYYIFLSEWAEIFGISEFSLRAFSAILGVLALFLVYYLSLYLFDEKVALISTFLASINLTLIWYSQEARQYSYLLFLSLLSAFFLLKSLKEGKTRHIVGLVIVNVIIAYSHFPWLIFIAFEGLYVLFMIYNDYVRKSSRNFMHGKGRKLHKKVIIAFLIIGILYLPIIDRAISTKSDTISLYGAPDLGEITKLGVQLSTWLYPTETMRQKIYNFSFDFTLYEWVLLFSVLLSALLMGLLFLIGIVKSLHKRESSVFLMLMFFFPLVSALSLSLMHPNITIFSIKQIIYIIPSFLILVSVGILRSRISKFSIAAIIVLSILPLHAYYTNIDKGQFREAAEFLPGNELIFLNIETAEVPFQFYSGEKDNIIGVKDVTEFKSYLNNVNSFWMLFTFTKYSDPEENIRKFLNENYISTDRKEFFDIELIHYIE